MDLFDTPLSEPAPPRADAPLADRLRPQSLDEVLGQDELVAPGGLLREAAESGRIPSLIFWGPPGSGKTTIARLLARAAAAPFASFSAVLATLPEVREVMQRARATRRATGRPTVVLLDEIHRWNRAQQDAFLPFVESGDVVLLGATTENPSFEVNGALLSRCRVVTLAPLAAAAILAILRRSLQDPRGIPDPPPASPEALEHLAQRAGGDARVALNALESAAALARAAGGGISPALIDRALVRPALKHDRAGEEHFNLLSALHKSLRNSDVDGALHWLARLIEAGEDPLVVARRLVRVAIEDVGLAEPRGLTLALAAKDAVRFLGQPEGDLALAEAAIFLAAAPKSNRANLAYEAAVADVRGGAAEPVPLHLRNAPTRLTERLGYGAGYRYAHDEPEGVAPIECLPPGLQGRRYFQPKSGLERTLGRWLRIWAERRRRAGAPEPPQEGS